MSRRSCGRQCRRSAIALLLAGSAMTADVLAGVVVSRPPREMHTRSPLTITLIYSGDGPAAQTYDVPREITATLTNGSTPPNPVRLKRQDDASDLLSVAPGTFRKIVFSAPWPDWAKGRMQLDVPDMDVSPVLVSLIRDDGKDGTEAGAGTADLANAARPLPADVTYAGVQPTLAPTRERAMRDGEIPLSNRFSAFEPVYFADGSNGANLARFQLSFKYRMTLADNPDSLAFFDNLYFGYTQTSIWDIREDSSPFHDTSYMPQLFYYVPDIGRHGSVVTRTGMMAGVQHESNGRDGPESRSIDIVYLRPSWDIGDLTGYHLTVAPKVYYYLEKSDNDDIQKYRGYADLLVKYGSPDGWQVAAMLRKGTKSWYGSIDTQVTYPLARLIGPGWGGYLWFGYFTGYGEDILDYNQKRWIARIGLSLIRW